MSNKISETSENEVKHDKDSLHYNKPFLKLHFLSDGFSWFYDDLGDESFINGFSQRRSILRFIKFKNTQKRKPHLTAIQERHSRFAFRW